MGKRFLLIAPTFYDYFELIKERLSLLGYIVDFIPVSYGEIFYANKNGFLKIGELIKNPGLIKTMKKNKSLGRELLKTKYDECLVINTFPFPVNILRTLREMGCIVKLFLWDDLNLLSNVTSVVPEFDGVFSFNYPDVLKLRNILPDCRNKIFYLPDFYIKQNDYKAVCEYDVCFIGTLNINTTERYKILGQLEKYPLKKFFYLKYNLGGPVKYNLLKMIWHLIQPKKLKEFRKLLQNIESSDINFAHKESLSLNQIRDIERKSRCIVDLSHLDRQGMTLNAVSAIGNNKKLITTNYTIKGAPFFAPENILIISPQNPNIPNEFLSSEMRNLDISCLEIGNWIRMIFDKEYYNSHIHKVTYVY